jgi:hypothetical protein
MRLKAQETDCFALRVWLWASLLSVCNVLLSACTVHGPSSGSGAVRTSAEQQASNRLVARVRELEGREDAAVAVDFRACAGVPVRALLLHTERHADAITLLELDLRGATPHTRLAQVQSPIAPGLADPPPQLETADVELEVAVARAALTDVWLAARARITIAEPTAPSGEIALRPLRMTSRDNSYALRVQTDQDVICARTHHGYGSNLDAPEQVPLQFAWEVMYRLAPTAQPIAAADAVREAIFDVWPEHRLQPAWQLPRLLALAAALPSERLIARIAPELDATDDETRIAAVNALAVATGRDLRRVDDGAPTGLDEIVSAYKAILRR